jgi:RNA polymerase sigma factor (sigma-70 family)
MGVQPDPRLALLLESADQPLKEEAWSALVREYSPLLLHAARTLGGDRDAVMDRYAHILECLRQDDFHRLRGYSLDRRTKFSTWLIVVATRLCLDHHRQRYGRKRSSPEMPATVQLQRQRKSLVDLTAAELDPDQIPDEAAATPDQPMRKGELSAALQDALATLEPRDQLLLRLRFEEGLSVPRIANSMGFASPFHAYRRLAQLFTELRLRLRSRGIEDSTL